MFSFAVTVLLTLPLTVSAGSLLPVPAISPAKRIAFRLMAGLALFFPSFMVCNALACSGDNSVCVVTALAMAHLLGKGHGLFALWADATQIAPS